MPDDDGGRRDDAIAAIMAACKLRTLDELQAVLELAARRSQPQSEAQETPQEAPSTGLSIVRGNKRARRYDPRNAPVDDAFEIIGGGTIDQILDCIANRLGKPIPPDRKVARRWVLRTMQSRPKKYRRWEDGVTWSPWGWSPPVAIAATQTGS